MNRNRSSARRTGKRSLRFALVAVLWLALWSPAAWAASGHGGGFSGGHGGGFSGDHSGGHPGMHSFGGGGFHHSPHHFDHGHGGFTFVYPYYPFYGYDPYYYYPYTPTCDRYSYNYNPDYCYDPYD